MLKITAIILLTGSLCAFGWAEGQQPKVKVNYLNVCSPSEVDQKELAASLAMIPIQPHFATDFEVARGRSTMQDEPSAVNAQTVAAKASVSDWVRIRHEFPPAAAFMNAQYSFSVDATGMTETLVLRTRDASKSGVLQISMQDSVTAGTPAQVLATDTPVDRIRVERSGKPSVVLARCAGAPQTQYESLFRTGSRVMANYRAALHVDQTVPADLARLGATNNSRERRLGKKQ